jgi:predicted DNA-binding transcriptional regulator YafY
MDQPKLERLLRVMQLLTDKGKRYTVAELSEILSISQRSVYRYIDTFESVGFIVNKHNGMVWLARESRHFKTIADLVYFTEEEAYVLKRAIEALDPMNPAVNGIKNKLYNLYDYNKVADIVVNENARAVVNNLLDAIATEKEVLLKDYRSSHSGNVSDRVVEPIQFGVNMVDILCYEISSGICKSFKVSRIEEVLHTGNSWSHQEKHVKIVTDSFRFSSTKTHFVKLKLSMVAANLLNEEYPLTIDKTVSVSDKEYIYSDQVCSFEGVGRFVLGLCNEVEVLEGKEFIDFLNMKRRGSKF